jgi:hypothetical protein
MELKIRTRTVREKVKHRVNSFLAIDVTDNGKELEELSRITKKQTFFRYGL